MSLQGVVDGVVANMIFAALIPIVLFIFWFFRKKFEYGITVPSKQLEGRFGITNFKGFSTANCFLYKTESGKSVKSEVYKFWYFGFKKGTKYFLYWIGNRGNGFTIIQESTEPMFVFEGKNLFFEKIKETGKTQMTVQDFFLFRLHE